MLAFRDCAAQHCIKYGGIEDMPKEMCADRPAGADVEVDDTENQRNDEKTRCDEHGSPDTMSAQKPTNTDQGGEREKIPRRTVENFARYVRGKSERKRDEAGQ